MRKLVDFVKDESGATAVEYALIAAATCLAIAAIMPTIKMNLSATFTDMKDSMD